MKKSLVLATIGVCTFVLGLSVNYALSDVAAPAYKVAVVDVQQVVQSSKEVNKLKTEQQKKFEDLKKFIEKAQKEITAATDETKRKALEDKYNKELNTKRQTIEQDYTKKLAAIDKSITDIIAKQAIAEKYNLVLSKNVVIYGGTNITPSITQKVK